MCPLCLQLYVERDRLEEGQAGGFGLLKSSVDVGDIVGVSGGIKRTDKGELSVVATSMQVGSPCTAHYSCCCFCCSYNCC